ncbi:MAG: ABC transporter substrate-binding protein [Lacisediminihabitans sp.]
MSHHLTRRPMQVAAACIAVGVLLSACSAGSTSGGGTATGAKDRTVTIDMEGYPASLDPGLQYDSATYPVYRNIYDQLLRRDSATLKPVPWIATAWKQTDPTTWEFTLRNDVKFSDGTTLTAKDAAFSLNRIIDKKFNSPQYANFSAVKDAKALDTTHLVIETHAPSPTLLSFLTTLSIVSEAYVEKVGNAKVNVVPMGSGPYTMQSATGGSEITLARNDSYWNGKPAIAKAIFRAVPTVAARIADLQSGRAQLVTTLGADQATQLKSDPSTQVLAVPTERVAYLALNVLGDTPTKDLKVRQAVVAAINYESLIKNLVGGYGKPVSAVLTPLAFGYPKNASSFSYDPQRAKALLAEVGTPHPVLKFPTSPSYNPQIVQAIQSDLQAVGFIVQISNTDQATFLKKVQSPAHDWGSVRFGRWSCSCLDADGVIYPLFRTGTVWSSYSNAQFDKAVDVGRTSTDVATRTKAYDTAFSILRSDLPGIGLYQEYAIYGASAGLQWKPDAAESMHLDQMSFSGKG